MPLEPARLWFEEHAKFDVPPYNAPGDSLSSSEVQIAHVNDLPGKKPAIALFDEGKAERFINALDAALGDTPLKAHPDGNAGLTDEQVLAIYEQLFTPKVEKGDGVRPDQWEEIYSEYDCNLLTFTALLYAVKSAAWRMFGKMIQIRAERYHPEHGTSHTLGDSYERVDFVIRDSNPLPGTLLQNTLLYLVEGKNPNVLSALKPLLAVSPFVINMVDNSSAGRKVLNKLIYYMLLYGQDHLVVTSFREAYILEIHDTTQGCFLSFSDLIDNDGASTLFRAMLGMVLVELDDDIPFVPFPAEEVFSQFRSQRTSSLRPIPGRSLNPGPGPGSGSGSSSNRKRGASPVNSSRSKRTAGHTTSGGPNSDHKSTTSTSQRGTEDPSGGTSGNNKAANIANQIVVPKITGSVSKMTISSEYWEVASKEGSVIHFYNFPVSNIFRAGLMEFERDPGAPFPSLPTSARIPRLTVVREVEKGSVGIVYEAELHNPANSNCMKYAIKVIDASLQNLVEYRNCYEQLKNEYAAYYLLALGKNVDGLDGLIQKFTPGCYGLYRPKDESMDIFALVIEFAGEVNRNSFRLWSINEKQSVLQSALSLHSIGLYHGDPEERNIAYHQKKKDSKDTKNSQNNEDSEDSHKFFDFGNSHFHQCPGIPHCEELRLLLFGLFGWDPPFDVIDFQIKTKRQYELPFLNLERRFRRVSRVKEEPALRRLDDLGKMYNGLFKGGKKVNESF